ncbi:MAG: MliC family protein [Brevundimonas sp.]|nr:MAG: MliC family protein [Brevundimonas sp.]
MPTVRPIICLILGTALTLPLVGCGQTVPPPGSDGDAVEQRAIEARTARRRTGAQVQERALTRTIQAVYICENAQQLTVDFDNPRQMATVRTSEGLAFDLYQQRAADGIWYRAEGRDLRGRGNEATWTVEGHPATRCRAVD